MALNPYIIQVPNKVTELLFFVQEPGFNHESVNKSADIVAHETPGLGLEDNMSFSLLSLQNHALDHCTHAQSATPFLGLFENEDTADDWATSCDNADQLSNVHAVDATSFIQQGGVLFRMESILPDLDNLRPVMPKKIDYLAWRQIPAELFWNFKVTSKGHPSMNCLRIFIL